MTRRLLEDRDEVVQTPFGRFLINPQDIIGSTLKAGTLWDGPGFLQVIAKEYARCGVGGATVLDVGAHQGSFSVYCAFLGAWRVVAVEPVPQTYQRLIANLDLNRTHCADTVIPVPVAAYDRLTQLWLTEVDPGNTGATTLLPVERETQQPGDPQTVRAAPLDDYRHFFGTVSLIKVDAQGCDGAALFGLRETIKRDHPAIVFEWEAAQADLHGYDLQAVRALLVGEGYEVREWPSHRNNYLAVWQAPPRELHIA